jgi:hypothetical protein
VLKPASNWFDTVAYFVFPPICRPRPTGHNEQTLRPDACSHRSARDNRHNRAWAGSTRPTLASAPAVGSQSGSLPPRCTLYKKRIVALNVNLTDDEAAKYAAELTRPHDRRYAPLQSYAAKYVTLTSEQADSHVRASGSRRSSDEAPAEVSVLVNSAWPTFDILIWPTLMVWSPCSFALPAVADAFSDLLIGGRSDHHNGPIQSIEISIIRLSVKPVRQRYLGFSNGLAPKLDPGIAARLTDPA